MTRLRLQARYLTALALGSQADDVWIATSPGGAKLVLEVAEQLDGVEDGAPYRRVHVDDPEQPFLKLHAATTRVHMSRRFAEIELETSDAHMGRRRLGFIRW